MDKLIKDLLTEREREYYKRLQELDDHISDNRLVSKEAQMNMMSGEGYTDPRFIKTTGYPLIDKWGLHPFPAEGSGQILSTTDLGMSGKKALVNPDNPGTYSPSKDTIVWKDVRDFGYPDKPPETTQRHEIFHRAADRSGWLNTFHKSPYLKKNVRSLSGSRGRMLKHLINEALAHSYEYGEDFPKNKDLKGDIRFRASKFKRLKNPDEIADEIFNNLGYLRKDFETYLEEINVEYLPEGISYKRITKPDRISELMEENGI